MIRDITIGQYYPAKSVIHKLDPRTKLFGTLVFIISVFLFHSIAGYRGSDGVPCRNDPDFHGSGEVYL